jgi:hypothetical protein
MAPVVGRVVVRREGDCGKVSGSEFGPPLRKLALQPLDD